jgi:1-acyl-sn-glycerol-3-phosphate acyltransferase
MNKTHIIQKPTPVLIRMGLWLLIWLHVIRGVVTLFLVFPYANIQTRHSHIKKWSKQLLSILGIDLSVINEGALKDSTYLLASNHISWVDIHAINAFSPIRFVAKSEVRSWPIFGWMAKQLGTVFIKRASSRHAQQVVLGMSEVLKTESVCIFPEGTSTLGNDVRPFKPNLFEAAVIADVPVYSLAIRYISKETGIRSEVPAFVGDMGLLESMANILKHRHLIVELAFFPPAASSPKPPNDRKWLALHSEEPIRKSITDGL